MQRLRTYFAKAHLGTELLDAFWTMLSASVPFAGTATVITRLGIPCRSGAARG